MHVGVAGLVQEAIPVDKVLPEQKRRAGQQEGQEQVEMDANPMLLPQ